MRTPAKSARVFSMPTPHAECSVRPPRCEAAIPVGAVTATFSSNASP